MRFDPKLISPEPPPLDEAGELLLPDDLAELAAQLGDDAQHLAALYAPGMEASGMESEPPQHFSSAKVAVEFNAAVSETEIAHLRRTSRWLWRASALVAAVAGLFVITAWWWPTAENSTHLVENVASERAAANATSEVVNLESSEAEPLLPVKTTVPPAAPPAPAEPGLFLHDYSGPELEGLYDLIGEQEDGTISI